MTINCKHVMRGLMSLFECQQRRYGTVIQTPLSRPDGDLIEVVVAEHIGGFTVSDLGETTRWFEMQGETLPSAALTAAILELHAAQGNNGEFFAKVSSVDEIAMAVIRVAQATSDLCNLPRRSLQERTHFPDMVKGKIKGWKIAVEDSDTKGLSGRKWVCMKTGDVHSGIRLVDTISSASSQYVQQVLFKTVAQWADLQHMRQGRETDFRSFVTVLDDRTTEWRDQDIRLLKAGSTVVRWSSADDLRGALVG